MAGVSLSVGPLTAISICSGYEGIGLGLKLVSDLQVICYIEIEPYCQRLLQARIRDGYLDDAPIWNDLTTFDGRPWRGLVDIVYGGIPCQGWSVAGKRKGVDDSRDLWPTTQRVLAEVVPDVFFLENVPGILPYYYAEIRPRLQSMGYRTAEGIFSAIEVGALHRRERFFALAYAASRGNRKSEQGISRENERIQGWQKDTGYAQRCGQIVANVDGERLQEDVRLTEDYQQAHRTGQSDDARSRAMAQFASDSDWWAIEPDVGRMAHGVASRMDRIRAIGNGVVPFVAAKAFARLSERLMA